jgi:hypothetical protein
LQTYSEKAIALVLDLSRQKNIAQAVGEFVEFFKFLETDDTAYLFNRERELFSKRGRAIACLSQYKFKKETLPFLVRDALEVLSEQSHFFHKVVYIVSDSLPEQAPMSRLRNCISKHGIEVKFFEVGSKNYSEFFEDFTMVENVKEAKKIIENDYRKDVIIED